MKHEIVELLRKIERNRKSWEMEPAPSGIYETKNHPGPG